MNSKDETKCIYLKYSRLASQKLLSKINCILDVSQMLPSCF